MNWASAVLSDLAYFQRGFDITKKEQRPGPYPVVSSSGIRSHHAVFKVPGPGVVIGRKGTLGKVHYVDSDYWPHDTSLWVKDFRGNWPRFVYYFLRTMRLERFDVGGANPTLNRNHIHGLPVQIPPLDTQHRIADTLSAYDDLIENNNRRMALLEEAIHLLYREWFVYLRFPGHERATVVDGVPEGWERRVFTDLAEFRNGYAFKRSQLGDVGKAIVKIPELRNGVTEKTPRNPGDRVPRKHHFDDGTLLFSWSGSFVVRVWNDGPALLNQHLFQVLPIAECGVAFLEVALIDSIDRFRSRSVGTTMKHIRRSALDEVELLVPSNSVLTAFMEAAEMVREQRSHLEQANRRLREARDLLLPRLMNGSIPV